MWRRPRWSHVVISLGVIAALAIAMPAFGISNSIKKAIKKEVAKQISSAKGPAGSNGASGLDGTARAYAKVQSFANVACSPDCTVQFSKGVSSVTHPAVGEYCVNAPGINPDTVSPAVTVEWGSTGSPEGNASAMIRSTHIDCGAAAFEVVTQRQASRTVCTSSSCATTASVAGDAADADDVAFTIVIP